MTEHFKGTFTDALVALGELREDSDVIIATMSAAYLLPTVSSSDRDLAFVAPMGAAAPMGLGLALARPDLRVIVVDGDGSILMNLGALVTIGALKPPNLFHVVVHNGEYAITGGQRIPSPGAESLADLARAAGFKSVAHLSEGAWAVDDLKAVLHSTGPAFVLLTVAGQYDRTSIPEATHLPQALKTQGPPGFAHLREILAND